jgi:hypothetical protein
MNDSGLFTNLPNLLRQMSYAWADPRPRPGFLEFARGDARPALRTVGRSYPAEQVRQSIRLPWREQPYFTPGFPLPLPRKSRVIIRKRLSHG